VVEQPCSLLCPCSWFSGQKRRIGPPMQTQNKRHKTHSHAHTHPCTHTSVRRCTLKNCVLRAGMWLLWRASEQGFCTGLTYWTAVSRCFTPKDKDCLRVLHGPLSICTQYTEYCPSTQVLKKVFFAGSGAQQYPDAAFHRRQLSIESGNSAYSANVQETWGFCQPRITFCFSLYFVCHDLFGSNTHQSHDDTPV
jgi:hypothetical protein